MPELQDTLPHNLRALGLHSGNVRILALLPLIYVAWADGKIQAAERSIIINFARKQGYLVNNAEEILNRWLLEEPSVESRETGLSTLVELARRHRGSGALLDVPDLHSLLSFSQDVARAAGGLFGIAFTVSETEELRLAHLADVLNIDDGQSWKELVEDLH